MSVKHLANGKFQAYVTGVDGKRYRKSFSTKAEAMTWEAETRLNLKAGKPVSMGVGGHQRLTIAGAMNRAYKERWQGTKGCPTAMKNARAAINFFGEKTDVNDVTTLRVREYIDHLQETNTGATINRKLAALSVMLKLAYKYDLLERMPILERQREASGPPRYLTEEQVNDLIKLAVKLGWQDMADIMSVAVYTGLRKGELLSLTADNVCRESNEIVIYDTKNGRPHRVPVPTVDIMCILIERSEKATAGGKLFPMGEVRLTYMWNRLIDLSHPLKARFHDLRHTYGSWLAQRGVPIETISRLMNHSSLTVTMRYAHLSPSNLHDAVGVLS